MHLLRVMVPVLVTLSLGCESSQSAPTRPAHSSVTAPSLGTAASFLVLGGTTVTNTGATTVFGDLGVDPGLAITGFPPGLVIGGVQHAGDATSLQAQNDVTAAYISLAGQACDFDLTDRDLGGMTLTQGVYCFSSGAQLTGTLTLDAEGDPGAVFVFQIGSTLITASDASVVYTNGGQACRTFWQVGSSATLGTDAVFAGNILALTSIALQTRVSLSGRALARNGAVTMDTNNVFTGTCAAASDAGLDGGGPQPTPTDAGLDGGVPVIDTDAGVDGGVPSGTDAGVDAGGPVEMGSDAGTVLCCGGSMCGPECIDLSADRANCGACGNACGAGELCTDGACAPCAATCAGACVDLASDRFHCGACGNACPGGAPCSEGACLPCATICGSVCVDLGFDHNNCGACDAVCAASEVCTSGACTPCPTSLCGGVCLSLDWDSQNCGSCGHSCAPGESCNTGACICE